MSTPCENCGSHIRVCVDCDFYKGKYIEIPDNATNGEVIKAMFHCLEKYEYEELYTHGIALAGNDNRVTWFTNEWWNAPYIRK